MANGQQQQQQAGRKVAAGGGGVAATLAATNDGAAGGRGAAGGWPTEGDTVHIAYTSNGSPYTNYQARGYHHGTGAARASADALLGPAPLLPHHSPSSSQRILAHHCCRLLQNLILYGTFKLAQRMPGGDKMVGFTRILHRSTDDALSPVIPTFRANPLHPGR